MSSPSSSSSAAASNAVKKGTTKGGWLLQRISGIPLTTGVKYANPFGLFIVALAVGGGGILVNELLIHKLSNTKTVDGLHRKVYSATVPKTKPDFILAWEKRYGNKNETLTLDQEKKQ